MRVGITWNRISQDNLVRELLKLLRRLLQGELRKTRRRKRSAPVLLAVLTIAIFGINRLLEEPTAPLPPKGAELACKISNVYDGDTVAASCEKGKLTIRIFGIDAPELGQKPWGKRSRDLLRNLMPRSVRLEVTDKDRYGRVVARLYQGNQDVGLELVRQGGAVVYTHYNKLRTYRLAQGEAKREKLGVWSRPGAHQEPWEWRKLNPR
jgi:endonuclease YncB( thermonuclease family)